MNWTSEGNGRSSRPERHDLQRRARWRKLTIQSIFGSQGNHFLTNCRRNLSLGHGLGDTQQPLWDHSSEKSEKVLQMTSKWRVPAPPLAHRESQRGANEDSLGPSGWLFTSKIGKSWFPWFWCPSQAKPLLLRVSGCQVQADQAPKGRLERSGQQQGGKVWLVSSVLLSELWKQPETLRKADQGGGQNYLRGQTYD